MRILLIHICLLLSACSAVQRPQERPVKALIPLYFDGHTIEGIITDKAELDVVQKKSVYMGGNVPEITGVELSITKNYGMEYSKHASNCYDYRTLKKQGWYPYTTFNRTMESFFVYNCGGLDFLTGAIPSKNSNFSDPPFSANVLDMLPASLYEFTSISGATLCPQKETLRDCLSLTTKEMFEVTDNELVFKSKVNDIYHNEVHYDASARGDYNHDGWEDLLLKFTYYLTEGTSNYMTEGTYRSYKSICLEWPRDQKIPSVFDCKFNAAAPNGLPP